jgi:peptidoglycan/LPS O-acetylase OafA/YrhL
MGHISEDWMTTLIQHGFYAVDFFFFIGGYVAILSLKRTVADYKGAPIWKFPLLYVFLLVKRYARLMPMITLTTLATVYLFPHLMPMTPLGLAGWDGYFAQLMPESWNLFWNWNPQGGEMKLNVGQFWYLTIDFQCYLVVPFILFAGLYSKFVAIAIPSVLIVASLGYTFWLTFHFEISAVAANEKWMKYYYFNLWARACVYFIGVLVALLIPGAPAKPAATKVETRPTVSANPNPEHVGFASTEFRCETPSKNSSGESLPYEVRPTETENGRRNQEKKIESGNVRTFWIGIVCVALLVFSAWSIHNYFAVGRPEDGIPLWVSAMQSNFGKVIFVTIVMVLLISICSTNKAFPTMIANNAMIQLVGQVSFGIYCWHQGLLLNIIGILNEWAPPTSDYYFLGQFFMFFFISFWISLWSTTTLELPCGDLWKMIETPSLKKLKSM